MTIKKLFLYSTVALFISCSNNADTTAEPFDSTLLEMPSEEVSTTPEFQNSFSALYAYLKTQDPAFTPEQYELTGKNVLDTSIRIR